MTTPCYVYAIAMEGDSPLLDAALKIGIARNPSARLAGLATGSPFRLSIRKTWKFLSESDARDFEGACHKEFAEKNLMREWFSVTVEDIDSLYESYFTIQDVEKEASDLLHELRLRSKSDVAELDVARLATTKGGRKLHPDGRLTTKDAASYIGMSMSWLNQSRCRGAGPVYMKLGGHVRYSIKDLDNWLDEQRRTAVYDFASRKVA